MQCRAVLHSPQPAMASSSTSSALHLHPLDWPLFPLESLSPTQLALAFYHPDYDTSSPVLPLVIYRLFSRLREAARWSPSSGARGLHTARLDFGLDDLDALDSGQLLLVPWHPGSDEAIEGKAQKVWRRRRERDFAKGLRWSAAVQEQEEKAVGEQKKPEPEPEKEATPNPPPPPPRSPTPTAASTPAYTPPPPAIPTRSPSPVVPLPPLPPLSDVLTPQVAAQLSTLYLTNLPPSISSLSLLRAIFPSSLAPSALILLKARPSSSSDVQPPRSAYAAFLDFDLRTLAMQEIVLMKLGAGGRWVPGVEMVESERAGWEWGDFGEEDREGIWRREQERVREQEKEAKRKEQEEKEAAVLKETATETPLPAPAVDSAPLAVSEAQAAPPQPSPPTIDSAPSSARPSPAPSATSTSPESPGPTYALGPSDPIPPHLVASFHQLTYRIRLPQPSSTNQHQLSFPLRSIADCVGELAGPPSSLYNPQKTGEVTDTWFGAFATEGDRGKAIALLNKRGLGMVVDGKRGVEEGWTWNDVSKAWRKRECARLREEMRLGSEKGRKEREEARKRRERNAIVAAGSGVKRAREEEATIDAPNANKQARLEDERPIPSSNAAFHPTSSVFSTTTTVTPATLLSTTTVVPPSPLPTPAPAPPPIEEGDDFNPFTDPLARPLPPGWRREKSRSTGEFFYSKEVDGATGEDGEGEAETTWENPVDVLEALEAKKAEAARLAEEKRKDEAREKEAREKAEREKQQKKEGGSECMVLDSDGDEAGIDGVPLATTARSPKGSPAPLGSTTAAAPATNGSTRPTQPRADSSISNGSAGFKRSFQPISLASTTSSSTPSTSISTAASVLAPIAFPSIPTGPSPSTSSLPSTSTPLPTGPRQPSYTRPSPSHSQPQPHAPAPAPTLLARTAPPIDIRGSAPGSNAAQMKRSVSASSSSSTGGQGGGGGAASLAARIDGSAGGGKKQNGAKNNGAVGKVNGGGDSLLDRLNDGGKSAGKDGRGSSPVSGKAVKSHHAQHPQQQQQGRTHPYQQQQHPKKAHLPPRPSLQSRFDVPPAPSALTGYSSHSHNGQTNRGGYPRGGGGGGVQVGNHSISTPGSGAGGGKGASGKAAKGGQNGGPSLLGRLG